VHRVWKDKKTVEDEPDSPILQFLLGYICHHHRCTGPEVGGGHIRLDAVIPRHSCSITICTALATTIYNRKIKGARPITTST
jgi:hypothetical protein